jgi:hypothetical protein
MSESGQIKTTELIQFKLTEVLTDKTLTVEFGPRIKCHLIVESKKISEKPIIDIINTVYKISEQKQKILERESKDLVSIQPGIYTKLEIETAKVLFHADEIPTEYTNPAHIEKAYQNILDNLIQKVPEYVSETSENKLETFLVLLSIPFIQKEDEYSKVIQMHLSYLKNLGFTYITFLNQIASSFYSQKDKIQQENVKDNPKGILINIGKTTQIGIMDTVILPEGFSDLNLGTTTVLNHSLAILRDLNVLGLGQDTVVQWLINEGRVDGKAPPTVKSIRRKEINITPILNTPRILFNYEAVTGMKNNPNSVVEGLKNSLDEIKFDQSKLQDILKTIVITGPGGFFKGIDTKFNEELRKIYPEYEINVIIGEDPLNSVTNGLLKYLSLWPKLKAFNLVENVKDIVIESAQQNVLQQALDMVKSLKNYISNIYELQKQAEKFAIFFDKLPNALKSFVNITINQESKEWSVKFNLFLNPFIKKAQMGGLKETDEIAIEFRNIGIEIAMLPPFIKPAFTKVFSSYVQGLKMIRGIHLDNINQEYLNILLESSLKFKNLPEYTLQELITESDLSKSVIMDVLPEYLKKYPNLGYINEKFVFFSDEKLKNLSTILETIKDKFFSSLNPNSNDALKSSLASIIKYYDFLIKGFTYKNNSELIKKYSVEKEEFEKLLSNKSTVLS